jgi:single-stranded-DNA-specific exonuclease
MTYRWSTAPSQPALCQFLSRELGVSLLLAQCLLNRGLSEPEAIRRFLEPRLKQLADPFLVPGMEIAVNRLWQARAGRESIVIFGDYDVDGVCATALLYQVLQALDWDVSYYLPHRLEEGYGLSRAGVENCLAKSPQATLLLAVDCGSNAVESIRWLQQRGIAVLVLDHHQVSDPPPPATALVNPQLALPDAPSFRELCSTGLAFKLAHALVKQGRAQDLEQEGQFDIRSFLDLVALGTVADLVPVTGENRILVTAGLDRLNRTERPGLLALRDVARISRPITGYEVGFQLAPRLNAAGRLEDALKALVLLLAPDRAAADHIARSLDAHNRERQEIERAIANQVLQTVQTRFDPARDFVIVEGDAAWHVGVVGIVASRVLQEFYRPTIILGGEADAWRGSGRSIEGFDLAEALRNCDDLLIRHGGHAMAAGLSVLPSNIGPLRDRLNELARRTLHPEQLQPTLKLDAEVRPSELTLERMRELTKLQQTGIGNPAVQLCMLNLTHARPPQRVGSDKQHLKMWVTDRQTICQAIWWGGGQESVPVDPFDLAFNPRLNHFNNTTTVQLSVLDWRPAAAA